jgi:hypothetical protein
VPVGGAIFITGIIRKQKQHSVVIEVSKLLPIIHFIKIALSKKGSALLSKGIIPSGQSPVFKGRSAPTKGLTPARATPTDILLDTLLLSWPLL